jgi:predicted nucleic acid-binding protein
MHRKIIANTSPLFYLHRLGYFDILHKLYGEIIIPFAVMKELEEGFYKKDIKDCWRE